MRHKSLFILGTLFFSLAYAKAPVPLWTVEITNNVSDASLQYESRSNQATENSPCLQAIPEDLRTSGSTYRAELPSANCAKIDQGRGWTLEPNEVITFIDVIIPGDKDPTSWACRLESEPGQCTDVNQPVYGTKRVRCDSGPLTPGVTKTQVIECHDVKKG